MRALRNLALCVCLLSLVAFTAPRSSMYVVVYGQENVPPYYGCLYSAVAVGGTGPYTYEWEVNGQVVGYDQTLFYYNNGSDHLVGVLVRDYYNEPAAGGVSVTVTTSVPDCDMER